MLKIIFIICLILYITISIILSKYLSYIMDYYSVETSSYLNARQIVEFILQEKKIFNIEIINSKNISVDNYNIKNKTIELSNDVYNSDKLSAKVIALHECGHVIQDFNNNFLLKFRQHLSPIVYIIKILGILFTLIGLLSFNDIFMIGFYMIITAFIFQLLTVCVEINASSIIYIITKKLKLLNNEELDIMKFILKISSIYYIFALFNIQVPSHKK